MPLSVSEDYSETAEMVCLACNCTDGVLYLVEFAPPDVAAAIDLGFLYARP